MKKVGGALLGLTLLVFFVIPGAAVQWAGRERQTPKLPALSAWRLESAQTEEAESAAAEAGTEGAEIEGLWALIGVTAEELETYVAGVVAAEMPASFEPEALKAQAVAARTYAVRDMLQTGGGFPQGQAYRSPEEQAALWGEDYPVWAEKIRQAVAATRGEILTYEQEPILAVFCAASAGVTESAGNVWSTDLPYLQSVASPGDREAPQFAVTVRIPREQAAAALLAACPAAGDLSGDLSPKLRIEDYTPAGYVKTVRVGAGSLTGRQFREALGLRSSAFTLEFAGDELVVTTRGHGHGAGMSQYGAQALAREGKTYREILAYYYQNCDLVKME